MTQRQAGTYRYINHLQPVCVANQIIGEHHSSLQAGVSPFSCIARVSNVKTSYCDSLDLVALFRDEALDSLLVGIVEDRRHGGSRGVVERDGERERKVWDWLRARYGEIQRQQGQDGIVDSRGRCLLLASGRLCWCGVSLVCVAAAVRRANQ